MKYGSGNCDFETSIDLCSFLEVLMLAFSCDAIVVSQTIRFFTFRQLIYHYLSFFSALDTSNFPRRLSFASSFVMLEVLYIHICGPTKQPLHKPVVGVTDTPPQKKTKRKEKQECQPLWDFGIKVYVSGMEMLGYCISSN